MHASLHKLLPIGIILVALLFFVATFFWVIIPLQNVITEKANAIEADRTLQASQESRVKELPQLRDTYDHILQNESKLDVLVSHDQMVPFIERIEALAHENAVLITITNQDQPGVKKTPVATNISADSTKSDTGSAAPAEKKKKDESILGNLPFNKYMSLRFDVRGKYADVLQLLHQLESLPYALDVVAFDIRQWQPSDTAVSGDSFSVRNPVVSTDGSIPLPDAPVEQHLVQAFFDVVVYTKD